MDAARLDCFLAAAQPGVAAAAAEAARGAAPAAVRYRWIGEDDCSVRLSPGSGRGRRRTLRLNSSLSPPWLNITTSGRVNIFDYYLLN